MPHPPEDVDALRAKLKALGYLDAGVDRFVLAPARADRGLWSIALLASLRIGLLAGLLLGLSGALAAGVRVPGLLTGLRDTAVFAALLTLVFGAAVSAVTIAGVLLAAGAVRWLRRRASVARLARPLATTAGVLVGAACLAYLTLWWGATNAPGNRAAWEATLAALLVAVLFSVLLGQATMTSALAVIANQAPGESVGPRRSLSLRWSLAIGAAGLLVSGVLLAATGRDSTASDASAPALTVAPTGLALTVVAIDGFDPEVFTSLGLETDAPRLRALLGGARLRRTAEDASRPADPVRQWTTIATGLPPSEHGVEALELRRVTGLRGMVAVQRAAPIAAATDLLRLTTPTVGAGVTRRAPAFWEVAAAAGMKTLALNWWASWPALPSDGAVLTERAVLRLDAGGTLEGEIEPASLYEALRPRWPHIKARAREWTGGPAGGSDHPLDQAMRQYALVDAEQVALADAVATEDLDLLTVYLPGLDIAGFEVFGGGSVSGTPGEVARRVQAQRHSYLVLERLLDLLDRPNRVMVLLALPGRSAATADGAFVVGPGTADRQEVRDVDVAPTLLHALGLPVSERLAGTPRPAMLPPPAAGRSVRHVAFYAPRRPAAGSVAPDAGLEDEMRERLRSLGYVQ